MKIYCKILNDLDNANAQADSKSLEAQSGNTRTWKQAIYAFATMLLESGIFVDCSVGFWRERRSARARIGPTSAKERFAK